MWRCSFRRRYPDFAPAQPASFVNVCQFWQIPLADADAWLTPLFQTNSVDNLTRFSSAAVDRFLEQAKATVDDTARLELYRKAQRTIIDDAPMVFLFHAIRVSAYNVRVTGLELNAQSYPVDRFGRVDLKTE